MIARLVFIAAVALCAIMPAAAHESRPLSIAVTQTSDSEYTLSWRAPPSIDRENAPAVTLGVACEGALAPSGDPLTGRGLYTCPDGLEGALLTIKYPFYNPSVSALIRVERRSGEVSTALLGPEITEWRAPAAESFTGVSRSFFTLGVEHILIGIDHILFLIGLLLLAQTPRRVLVTVTGFTLAHSVTLALVALDVVRVSIPVIEALIALSIVFVAAEIARGRRDTIAWRRPVVVAMSFGLLHGAGFAAALGEIGLPQTQRAAALFFFNVGVEAGQLMLVIAAFAAVWLIRRGHGLFSDRAQPVFPALAPRLFAYGLGVIAAYWFVERTTAALA